MVPPLIQIATLSIANPAAMVRTMGLAVQKPIIAPCKAVIATPASSVTSDRHGQAELLGLKKIMAATVAVCDTASDTADPAIMTTVAPIAVMPTHALEARIARALARLKNRVVKAPATMTASTTTTIPMSSGSGRQPARARALPGPPARTLPVRRAGRGRLRPRP